MHYLLFTHEVFISDGLASQRMAYGPSLSEKLETMDKARLCCVDVDVLIASAPQDYVDKKDSLLAQKFAEAYSNEYITLNEKIDSNVFQVVGIKADKVKEIYALMPSSKVDAFVPYAVAIRALLLQKQTDMTRLIVFIDDLGQEKLVTVFEGMKFSRTRTIYAQDAQGILPDIKRSSIDFNKKLGEFANSRAVGPKLITNNGLLAEDIKNLEPDLDIEFLDSSNPGLKGLEFIDTQIKYRIHEDIILERRRKELRLRVKSLILSIVICLAAALFFGFNHVTYSLASRDGEGERLTNLKLNEALKTMDQYVYQDALRESKNLNYSSVFFEVSGLLPSTYAMTSFKFINQQNHWVFDTYLLSQDDQFYDEIPRTGILKNAEVKDFFIKNRPGKYLKVTL